ncbi:MAG: hypothetical protein K8R21_07285 [Leptospira sp.]|nr:hypothetical protein [Leptospira sp.]
MSNEISFLVTGKPEFKETIKSRSQNLLVLKLGNYDMSEWTSIIQQSLINFGNV